MPRREEASASTQQEWHAWVKVSMVVVVAGLLLTVVVWQFGDDILYGLFGEGETSRSMSILQIERDEPTNAVNESALAQDQPWLAKNLDEMIAKGERARGFEVNSTTLGWCGYVSKGGTCPAWFSYRNLTFVIGSSQE